MSTPSSCPIALNSFTARLAKTLKAHPKRIVFPEGEDIRILRVARRLVDEEVISPILLGNKEKIKALAESEGISTQFIRIINPEKSSDLPLFCKRFERIEALKQNVVANVEETMSRPHYFASMMVQYGQADGMVAGNLSSAPIILRAVTRMIKPDPNCKNIFGLMCARIPDFIPFGNDGLLFMADTAMTSVPTIEELASIAVNTGIIVHHSLGRPVRVAMLSSSTHGSNPTLPAQRVKAATALAQSQIHEMGLTENIDIVGEIQADAAIDPDAASLRLRMNLEKGAIPPADAIIFPTLDAADITIKTLDLFPDIRLYGQYLCGLDLPVVQVSRRSSEERLFGCALIAGFEAVKFHHAHPEGKAELY